jgi:hypothetical protein
MPLTDSLVVVTQYLFDKFNVQSVKDQFGLTDVFYGDQSLIPRSPAMCIESGPKDRQLQGAMRRTQNNISVFLLLYHSEIRSPQSNRKDADTLAEAIELFVHQDKTLGGLVTHCYCTQVVPSYVTKSDQPMRAARIVVEATTTTNLP